MGRDKALLAIEGTPMVVRVAEALRAAGARAVMAVGREPGALASLGLGSVADERPGEGPVAGIATALGWAGRDDPDEDPLVLVTGCDLITPSPSAMAATVYALASAPTSQVAVPASGGRRQWAHAAWRGSAAPALAAALGAGERAVGRAVAAAGLAVVEVRGLDPAALADADIPADLPPRSFPG
jgi:molybdopterin-guanine dinucleotide biosynthesis protein A